MCFCQWLLAMQNLALVEKVEGLAKAKGIKPGQLALAWVHAQVLLSCAPSCIACMCLSCWQLETLLAYA